MRRPWKLTYWAAPVYLTYFTAGRGLVTIPLIILFMILMQTSQVMNSYTLVWWEAKYVESLFGPPSYAHFTFFDSTWRRSNSFYQILYGCLGIAQAINTFFWCANWS